MENKDLRKSALEWWRGLDDFTQQFIADKHHPTDDFMLTHTSSSRIETMYLKETQHKSI